MEEKTRKFVKKHINHLLNQYTNMPAQCKELLYLLFNQGMRHAHARGVSAAVKANPKAFDTFSEMVDSKYFLEILEREMVDSKSQEAKFVMQKMMGKIWRIKL